MTKRTVMLLAAFALGMVFSLKTEGQDTQTHRRVLYFTKSSGFEHSVVRRQGDRLSHSEQILTQVFARHGIELVCTKDGGLINADHLKNFDTVMFYTSGNLLQAGTDKAPPVSAEGMEALFDYINNGGGFIAIHAGTDTLRTEPEPSTYTQMVGGTFAGHGAQEFATLKVVDPKFPAVAQLPVEFRMIDEWYLHKQINALENMHVLIMLDTQSMEQEMYTKLPPQPITWCSKHGQGRVFVTGLGHREDVWEMPLMQGMLLDAVDWTSGLVDGDASPNYQEYLK